jgi:hypothetical protein
MTTNNAAASQLKLNVTNIKSVLVKGNKSMTRLKAFKAKTIFNMEQDDLRKKEEESLEAVKPKKKKITADKSPVKSKGGILNKLMTFAGIILGGVLVNALPAILKKLRDIFTSVFNFLKPVGKAIMGIINFISGDTMDMSKYDSQKATVDDQFAQMKTASEELNTEAESAASLEKLLETPAEVDEIIGEGGKVDSETKESQVENEASQVASTENATDTGGMIETTTPEEKEKAAIQTMKSDPTVQKKNEGGKISTSKGNIKDSVPVLLSPGEFVINQKIAKTIGYEKLKQINTITTNSSAQISPKTPNDISMLNNGKKKGKTTIIMQTQVVEKVTPVPV